jgi:hypothetical protein
MRVLMARRLITSGWTVNGYDINPVTTTALEYVNGKASTSLALATTNASIMTLMVANGGRNVNYDDIRCKGRLCREIDYHLLNCILKPAVRL